MDIAKAKQRIEYLIFATIIVIPFIIFPLGQYGDFFYAPKVYGLVVIAAMFIFILLLSGNNINELFKFDRINLCLLVYLLLLCVSLFFALDIKMAIMGREYRVEGLITLVCYFLLFFAARTVPLYGRKFFLGIIISSTILSIYGIAQFYGFDPFPRDFIRSDWKIAFATFGNPNFFGSYLVLVIPVVLHDCIGNKKNVSGICYAIMLYALCCTLTRSAWIGVGVALVLYFVIYIFMSENMKLDKQRVIYVLLITFVAIFIFNMTTGNRFLGRFSSISKDAREVVKNDEGVTENAIDHSGATESGLARIYIWKKVIELIKEKPLTGYGIENLMEPFEEKFSHESVSKRLGYGKITRPPDKAHNEYLNIAVSTGIPSLLMYLLFIILVLKKGLAKIKQNLVYLPFLAAATGYFAQAFFNISVASVAYVYWVFLGLISGYDSR